MFSSSTIYLEKQLKDLKDKIDKLEKKINEMDKTLFLSEYKITSLHKNIENIQEAFKFLSDAINQTVNNYDTINKE